MKKSLRIFLALIMILSLVGCGKKAEPKKKDKAKEQEQTPIEKQVDDITKTKQGDLEFTNIKITAFGATNKVSAKVTNTGSKTLSFKAVLYMKNTAGLILGKVDKVVENLKSKASTDISIDIMGDYTTVNFFEVVVENLKES